MHPIVVGLVAVLGVLAVASLIVFLWKANSALANSDTLAGDSDVMLIDLTAHPSR